jgi:hypothetical protein
MYRIDPAHKPRLYTLLSKRTGQPVSGDTAMLQAFAAAFRDTKQIRDWLKDNAVPYEEEFDSWA